MLCGYSSHTVHGQNASQNCKGRQNAAHVMVQGGQNANLIKTLHICLFIYLGFYVFMFQCRFQHCTGHIMMGSWKGRGNQYIQFIRVLYCKLPTNSKQLPAFPLEDVPGTQPQPQRWEARVLPLCHHGPPLHI